MDRMYYNTSLRFRKGLKTVSLPYGTIIASPTGATFVDCFGSKHKANSKEFKKGQKKYKLFANLMALALILGLFAALVLKLTYLTGDYGFLLEYVSGIYVLIFCGLTMLDLIWFLF